MINVNGKYAGKCLDIPGGIADVNDLIIALEEYIINPDQVEKNSYLALEAAKKFTMEACVFNYLKVFSN
jgi:glycosyltransferase involved in cell wall biosynthesis